MFLLTPPLSTWLVTGDPCLDLSCHQPYNRTIRVESCLLLIVSFITGMQEKTPDIPDVQFRTI